MKIDRHNYEEFFLLYVDNELNNSERRQVELFVQENPDLEEEWLMLQQSKLIADDNIVFERKDLLMKEESSFINRGNYEEWLVLYTDNELNDAEKAGVEKFIAEHPSIKEELALFQQTRLNPEKIVFPGKSSLYRKEEKVRVISMKWWRMAAAAVLIIAAGITTYSVMKNDSAPVTPGNELVSEKKQPSDNKTVKTGIQKNESENPKISPVIKQQSSETVLISPVRNNKKESQSKQQQVDKLVKQKDNNLPVPEKQPVVVKTDKPENKPSVINVTEINISDPQIKNAVALNEKLHKHLFNEKDVTKLTPEAPEIAEYASNTENKKIRGFFRKASRFIERTTNINPANDDDRVLIGGVAINLK